VYVIQQDEALQQQFKADVSMYKKKEIVFIDETYKTPCVHMVTAWIKSTEVCGEGEHLSTIAAISMQGIIS